MRNKQNATTQIEPMRMDEVVYTAKVLCGNVRSTKYTMAEWTLYVYLMPTRMSCSEGRIDPQGHFEHRQSREDAASNKVEGVARYLIKCGNVSATPVILVTTLLRNLRRSTHQCTTLFFQLLHHQGWM